MVDLVKTIRDFLNSINLSGRVLSISNDGVNTTLVLENSYNLREYMPLNVDGTDYEVISANTQANTVVVAGVIPTANVYVVPNPFFFQGSDYIVGVEFDMKEDEQRLPMFWMNRPIRQRWYGEGTNLASEPDFYFLLADWANYKDWVADDYDSERLEGLTKLAWKIRQEAIDYRKFGSVDRFDVEVLPKLGTYSRAGAENSLLNHTLTGIGIRVTIPIKKCCT